MLNPLSALGSAGSQGLHADKALRQKARAGTISGTLSLKKARRTLGSVMARR